MSFLWLLPSSGLVVLWMVLHACEAAGFPVEGLVLRGGWILSSGLKIATLGILPLLAHHAAVAVNTDPRRRGPFLLRWCGGVVLLVLLGWACRDFAALHLSNPAVKVFGPSVPAPMGTERLHGRWLWAWERGLVQASEAALWCGIGLLFSVVASRTRYAAAPVYAAAAVATLIWVRFTGWFVIDWDIWIGDLWTGSLFFDHILFWVTGDPFTSLSVLPLMLASAIFWWTAGAGNRATG